MVYALEQKILGLAKESAIARGTLVAPSKYVAIERGSEFDYRLNLLEDEQLRGILDKYPPNPGTKDGSATIRFDAESMNLGDFLYSLLGDVTSAQQGATAAYKHTFKRHASLLQLPSYSLYMNRGIEKKSYNNACVKSMAFSITPDGKVSVENVILFKQEADSVATMSPVWTDPAPFTFYQATLTVDSVANTDIRELNLTIDNQAIAKRVLNNSQDIADVLSVGKLLISGGFTIYVETATEAQRDKFLAGSEATLQIDLIGATITAPYTHKLTFILPRIHYTAFPYGETDGILTCAVSFNSYYKIASAYSILVELTNTITVY